MFKKFLIYFFVLLLMVLGFYLWQGIYLPKDRSSQEDKLFIINRGEGVREIAKNLESQGFIRSRRFFELYVFLNDKALRLQSGEYKLNPYLDISQIAEKLFLGLVIPSDIRVTIPEGFSLRQIDARLAYLNLIEEGELLERSYLKGYLFPDTYMFDKRAGLDQIVDTMKANFDRKLTQELRERIKTQERTIEDVIIMASLIEEEVAEDYDRRIVSGIFWRRLDNNHLLQSCATIAYILGVNRRRYSFEDTRVESPYNTYLNLGLPPSPISNPGLSAIKAAINPKTTNYNFFLSDAEGRTVFSRTFQEHRIAKQRYLE